MSEKSHKIILVVDDDRSIQLCLLDALQDEGYVAHAVNNGNEALAYLSAPCLEVGLILLDAMMPVMDGFAFRAEQVKNKQLAEIPTVILSADGNNKKKAEDLGIAFCRKPFQLADLFGTIERHFSPEGGP